MRVTFHGVRGSTPCSSDDQRRYGGNTSCVVLEVPGLDPVVFDLGTGLRPWGLTLPQDGSFRATALVTHLHWDHVQGLPFLTPLHAEGAHLDVFGPTDGGSLIEAVDAFFRPPYFPVRPADLAGDMALTDLEEGTFETGGVRVLAREVPHTGRTFGFRVEASGLAVAYVPDHQQPMDGSLSVLDSVLELCDGADLVVHDAQFTEAEFARKPHWGHCTYEYALHVAREAGARRLALFHHDPCRSDDALDAQATLLATAAERDGIEVLAAAEGAAVDLAVRQPVGV